MNPSDTPVPHKPNALIRQPYAITVAKHDFDVHEMRIMTRITQELQNDMLYGKTRSEVQRTIFGDKILRIPTQSLLPQGSQNYSAVKRALKALEQKVITIQGKDKDGIYETNARLIMKSKYYLNNQMVEIQLDRDILPDYLALASYSAYMVEVSMSSSSRYVMRLYQFISHWKERSRLEVSLDDLRELLGVEDKYAKPKDLRKHILEPCSKDLSARADVWFEIEGTTKVGRSIKGFQFKIYKKNNDPRNASAHSQNIKNLLRELFDLRDYHLSKIEGIINKTELHKHIYEKIHQIEAQIRKGQVENVKAYVVAALQNEFASFAQDEFDLPISR